MAQIKKFQNPAGPITPNESNEYGKIMKNGVLYEVNDNTLLWLDAHSVYGKAIAKKLREGQTQIIDVMADGSGIIRDLDVEDPSLTIKQEVKTTKSPRLFEGRRVREAREKLRHLANYDYKTFIPETVTKTPFVFSTLKPEYGLVDDKVSWLAGETNSKIIRRLTDLKNGTVDVPENKEFKKLNDILATFKSAQESDVGKTRTNGSDIYTYLINKLQTGKLDDWDWNILKSASIVKGTVPTPDPKEKTKNLLTNLGLGDFVNSDYFEVEGDDLKVTEALKKKLNLSDQKAYRFTKNDEELLGKNLSGYYILDDILVKHDDPRLVNFKKSTEWSKFVNLFNGGDHRAASKIVGFYDALTRNIYDYKNQNTDNFYLFDIENPYADLSGILDISFEPFTNADRNTLAPIAIYQELTTTTDSEGLRIPLIMTQSIKNNEKFATGKFTEGFKGVYEYFNQHGRLVKTATAPSTYLTEISPNDSGTYTIKSRKGDITIEVKNGEYHISVKKGGKQIGPVNVCTTKKDAQIAVQYAIIHGKPPVASNKKGGKISKYTQGDRISLPNVEEITDWAGGVAPYVELGISGASNRRLEQLEKKAIDKEFLGAMPSMPISTPHIQINTNPFTTRFDKTKAENLSRMREINSGLSDQRLRMANMNANYGHLQKGEEKLYDTMYNHISNINLQNSNFDLENLKAEKQVADTTRNLAGQAAAKKLRATAHYNEINRNNFVTMFSELRKQYNDYKAQENLANNWQGYMDLYNQWLKAPEGEQKTQLANQMQIYKQVMMNGSSNYNPLTWRRFKFKSKQ